VNGQSILIALETIHKHPASATKSIVLLDLRSDARVVDGGHQFFFVAQVEEEKVGGCREFRPEEIPALSAQHRIMEAIHGVQPQLVFSINLRDLNGEFRYPLEEFRGGDRLFQAAPQVLQQNLKIQRGGTTSQDLRIPTS